MTGSSFDQSASSSNQAFSSQQKKLLKSQLALANFQAGQLDIQEDLQATIRPQFLESAEVSAEDADRALEGAFDEQAIQLNLTDLFNQDFDTQGIATPEELRLIEGAASSQLDAGAISINDRISNELQILRDETAQARGLRSTDTPIVDQGSRIVASGVREFGDLAQRVRGQQAAQNLQQPLARSAQTQGQISSQQALSQTAEIFQEELRQRSFQNRISALNLDTASGLGLIQASTPPFTGLQPLSSRSNSEDSFSF